MTSECAQDNGAYYKTLYQFTTDGQVLVYCPI
jgi:hypothetical protein